MKGALTFSRFRAEAAEERPRDLRRWLAKGFREHAFEPLDPKDEEDASSGWVEVGDGERTELAPGSLLFGDYVLATWRIDRLRVPSAAIKHELETWSKGFEEREGRPPRKAEKKNEKEVVAQRLKKRAFPSRAFTDVSWNLSTDHLEIWSTSRKVIDEIQASLESLFAVTLRPLSPGAYASTLELTSDEEDELLPTAELLRDPAFGA